MRIKRALYGFGMPIAVLTIGCGGKHSQPPIPAPTINSFSPGSGTVDTQITINGTNLKDTSVVKFNGSTATFTIVNDTEVTAKVPLDAKSGTLTITTPGGTATSASSFTVIEEKAFWLNDLDPDKKWTQATFTKSYQNKRCNIWVRREDQSSISPELIQHYGDYFLNNSWNDVTNNVHNPTEFFNDPERVNILFYKASADDKAGYFWYKDFFSQKDIDQAGFGDRVKSNEGNYFYININSAVNAQYQAYATHFTQGTLTHEFQHMCNAHYFFFDPVGSNKQRQMDAWANEFCSVTMESLFAKQLDIYIPSYKVEDKFKTGSNAFLQWKNDFTQYIQVSLLGSYLTSQIPEANRSNLYKRFLANTWTEGSDSAVTLTSVEDLMATLQDPQVSWKPDGWKTITDYASQSTDIRDNWVHLFRGFATAVTGKNDTYNTYLAAHSKQAMTPACASALGGSFNLQPSGFFIGQTFVQNLDSQVLADASADPSGRQPAYAFIFNATLPSMDVLQDPEATSEGATTTVGNSQFVAPPPQQGKVGLDLLANWKFNRSMGIAPWGKAVPSYGKALSFSANRAEPVFRTTILGAGNPANGGSATAGYNYCFYVAR